MYRISTGICVESVDITLKKVTNSKEFKFEIQNDCM